MKSRRLSTTVLVLVPLALGILSGCSGGDNGNPDSLPGTPDTTTGSVQIDATAGGANNPDPNDPAKKYTYFNLDTAQVVELSDADAAVNGAWHIAFKRTSIKLNGGVSGPGAVKGAIADARDDFYDAMTGDPDVPVFTNATANSELAAFNTVTSTEGLSFAEDRNIPYIKGDGTRNGWWLYSGPPDHIISANPDQWWLIRSAAANSYVKFHVTNIVQASRDITLTLFIQGVADDAFSTTAIPWTAAIGATGGSKCFDIDTAMEVDCSMTGWDIKAEVAGQAWNIRTNGGVSGSGSGSAFGPFDDTGITGYVSGTTSPGGASIKAMYGQDSAGGLFADNTWYAYNVLSQSPPVLWSNYRVYAIDTGTNFHKLQILGYYDQAGVSGNYTFRHASVAGQNRFETVNVVLNEWAVTPDKNTINAGPVNFSVTNTGPTDVHEFVIIKTDLAANSLPIDANGNVDENSTNITIIGEIEDIAVAANARATFNLEPGNYVLMCNIWDVGEQEAHFTEGMYAAFTVVQ